MFFLWNDSELARLIISFAEDESSRMRMSKLAKRWAIYSPTVAADATLEAVRTVVTNRKRIS